MSQDFIGIIQSRGFVHQMTDEAGLRAYLATGKPEEKRAYIGFDCTAPSLHVGSLLQIMLLRWWQKCGHQPIVLLGGGTTKIGDPSGKDASRPPLTDKTIEENMNGLKGVFRKLLDTDAEPIYVNNAAWLDQLEYVPFLRQYGRMFSINRMLGKDSVKLRLEREQHLSFLEFNYMILQAYDFLKLALDYKCRVQMGGSDQWGNIVTGIELFHANAGLDPDQKKRKLAEPSQSAISFSRYDIYGITSPLITTSSGAKMGKTAAGAVWLNADLTSPYDYWQYWRNTEDADVVRFLKLFTELPLPEIEKLGKLKDAAINEAKIKLATAATALLHGREAAERAAKTASETFGGAGVSEDLPEIELSTTELAEGVPLYALLVKAGFAASNSEARKLIQGNGVRLQDAVVSDDKTRITQKDFGKEKFIKLSAGKKRHAILRAK